MAKETIGFWILTPALSIHISVLNKPEFYHECCSLIGYAAHFDNNTTTRLPVMN